MKKQRTTISIIIPYYNEEKQIKRLWGTLRKTLDPLCKSQDIDFIFIDDGSTDNTYSLIKEFAIVDQRIKIIRLQENTGKEIAVLAGLDHSHSDAAVIMDADLQHPPEIIPEMVDTWLKGDYQIVEVEKNNAVSSGIFKKIFTALFYWLYFRINGTDLRTSTDFKLLDSGVVKLFCKYRNSKRFNRGFLAHLDVPRKKIYCTLPLRKDDMSKWSYLKLFKLSWDALSNSPSKKTNNSPNIIPYTVRELFNIDG